MKKPLKALEPFSVLLALGVFVFSSVMAGGLSDGITLEQAAAIIAEKVEHEGYRYSPDMWSEITFYETPDNECLDTFIRKGIEANLSLEELEKDQADAAQIREMLQGRKYYLFMLDPERQGILFGDLVCIFVDQKTGKILSRDNT